MKKNLVKNSLCLILALALCFGDFATMLRRADVSAVAAEASAEEMQTAFVGQSEPEQSEGVIRPEDIDEGLSLYSLDDIRGRRVTVRQPVMEVLQDNIVRKLPEVMDNTYQMLDFTTGAEMHALAKIDFASNSELEPGNKDHPMYPMKGLDRSPKDSDGNVTKQKYFSEFTKYMLLRQAYYFNTHVSDIIQNNQLKKHPAADFIYGKIPDDAKAVRMRIVTDPIYRSPITTGLYLAPGEAATVKIKGLKKGETVTLYTHHQDTLGYQGYDENGKGFGKMESYLAYWDEKIVGEARRAAAANETPDFDKFHYGLHGQWQWQNQKVPCMGTTFNIVGTGEDMEVKIGSMYGGPLYVKPTSDMVEMEISGAVLTPHFVLGVTTVREFEEQLRKAPGLIATLDVENGQLIGPAEAMRNADDIEKLAYFWHSVFAIDISLNGRDYNYNMTMCYDMHVPAGEAVALNSNFCAQPEYWFPICMNYETLTTKGNWGTFHELGHVQAKTHGVNWGFCDGDGEVWNNTLILLIYSMLCNMDSRVIGVEHGEYVHPFTAVERSQKITQLCTDKQTGETRKIEDYGEINEGNGAHFDQLSMYATLLHSFGPEKFVDMFYTYKMNPAYCPNKRADFVYRIGVVDRVNILDWVNDNYFANISDDMFTDSQLDFLHNLPTFVPVAYRWANGIDGHETARKHDVDGKHSTVFDVSASNFSSPEAVEVLAVTRPQHGTIEYKESEQKVIYTPPAEVTEYDRFDIIVKTDGGRQVTLNVNLRLLYRGVYTEVWDLGSQQAQLLGTKQPSISTAETYITGKPATSAETGSVPGKGDFNHSNLEYFRSSFKFIATKTGEHTFYVRADDAAKVQFFKNKDSAAGNADHTISTTSVYSFSENANCKWTVHLTAGDTVFISAALVNWGGQGHLHIGLRMPGEEKVALKDIKDIPIQNIVGENVSQADLAKADAFKGWQPRFVDSIKNATIDYQTSNSGWKVIEAPASEGGEAAQEQYRKNMVDGDESTIYHSKYNGYTVKPPHVFIIDTGADQTFNYFDIIRRTNGNDKLLSYTLYACTGTEYPNLNHEGTEDSNGWHLLFEGESSDINAARQRISFQRTQIRYFKLIVTANSGHTVIKEVNAGIESKLSQTVRPTNYMTNTQDLADSEAEGFVENSANGKLSTTKDGATFEFKFLGSGFELYADTAHTYGKASVSVDGEEKDEIDLDDEPMFNKLVFLCEDLDTAEHTVVVTVLGEKPFNISFINVKYGTPVAADEYPAVDGDYGDIQVARQFTREWKTFVKDYKTLTSIQFLHTEPQDYKDTYVRIDTYIRLYRSGSKIAFVYPGKILAPIECGSLFSGCEKLTEFVPENFDTEYMRGAMNMFYGCRSLTNLDLSGFTTQNVLSFGKMFGDCTSLADMDLRNFKLDENANLYRIFDNCTALETIELPEMTVSARAFRSRAAVSEISFELPYVYQDEDTGEFITDLVLNASTAGHRLRLHKDHVFLSMGEHAQQDPTCEKEGVLAYKTCSVCNCKFDYQNGKTLYRAADLVIPKTGHSYGYDIYGNPADWTPPTCTKPGGFCTHTCEKCGAACPDDGGIVEMPTLGHSYELDKSGEHANGYTIEFFKDEETVNTEMVDEEGNVYFVQEEKTVKGRARVTYYLICEGIGDYGDDMLDESKWTKCHHRTQVVFEFECDTHTDATCTDAEMFFFHFSIDLDDFNQAMAEQDEQDQSKDFISEGENGFRQLTIDHVYEGAEIEGASLALGHKFETVAAIPATCEGHGSTEGKRCSVCGFTENITSTAPHGHDYQYQPERKPTCTEAGHAAGDVCIYCGKEKDGVKHIDPLGHDFSVEIPEELPTCTKVGHTEGKKCSRCDAVEGCDVEDDLGHLEEVIPGRAPTETESGLTEGLRCPRCGEIIKAQEEIPALGGESGPGVIVWVMIGVGAAALAAAAAVTVVLVLRKKRRN